MAFSMSRRNWLSVAFAAFLVFATGPARAEADIISASEAHERAQSGELVIIDVRSKQEWRETGVPEGAETVTIHNRGGLPAFIAEVKKTLGDDKDRPVAFICASGVRSTAASRMLSGEGYKNILNIREGMLGNNRDGPGWIDRGLPTENCPDC
ncbi:MAG: rhodanese-like domain-containing protein [Rhodovibrionaceae bacterium]|nr:rhodanese-like domain-containing protein [Rhodovibrionaceae bacterium]